MATTPTTHGSVQGAYDFKFTTDNGHPLIQKVYYVTTSVERTQTSTPAQVPVCPGSDAIGFKVRGIPAVIQFSSATPGSFFLISENPYFGNNPPALLAGTSHPVYYSTVAGTDGSAEIDVPETGAAYYWNCWVPPNPSLPVQYFQRKTLPSVTIPAPISGGTVSITASACR